MSEASFHRSVARPVRVATGRPLPLGYGLLVAAVASLGIWFAIGWALAKLFS